MWLKCLNVSVCGVDECCDEAVQKSREQLSAAGLVLELEQTSGQEQALHEVVRNGGCAGEHGRSGDVLASPDGVRRRRSRRAAATVWSTDPAGRRAFQAAVLGGGVPYDCTGW